MDVAVFDRVRASDFGRIICENCRRRRVYFLGIHKRSRLIDFAENLGLLKKIPIDELSRIQYRDEGDRWSGRQLSLSGLPTRMAGSLVEAVRDLTSLTLSERFCSALVFKTLSKNLHEWGLFDNWIRSMPNAAAVIHTSDPAAESIFASTFTNVHVKMRPAVALVFIKVLALPLRLESIQQFVMRRMLSDANQTPESKGRSGELLFILNRSLAYGHLYSYDYIYDQVPSSPLHHSKVRHLLLNPDLVGDIPGQSRHLSDLYTKRLKRLLQSLLLFMKLQDGQYLTVEQRTLFVICHLAVQGVQLRDRLRQFFPNCTVAYLAFEFQVPASLNLALKLASIETVAAVERPNMCFHEGSSIISDIYLVGDAAQGRAVQRINASYVRQYRVVGLWRTDLLFKEMRKRESPNYVNSGRRKSILVLPFVILGSRGEINDGFVTGSGFQHFMTEVASAADRFPDVNFVIRGKNLQWLDMEAGKRVLPLLARAPNIHIDKHFGEVGAAYRLAAESDVVLAKYTSMVDECIYAGIPVVVHDYTYNASGRFRASNAYLPGDIFCQDRNQMLTQLGVCLTRKDDGLAGRQSVHHEFDGQVQARIREELRKEITKSQIYPA